MPLAPVIVLVFAAEKVAVPRPARLMPSPVLLLESTSSNAGVVWIVVPVTSTAGPPVAFTFAVPAAGTVAVPAFASRNPVPPVVVSDRSPNVVVPVVLVKFTPPLPEPVTVMPSKVLVPRPTGVATVPVTLRPPRSRS